MRRSNDVFIFLGTKMITPILHIHFASLTLCERRFQKIYNWYMYKHHRMSSESRSLCQNALTVYDHHFNGIIQLSSKHLTPLIILHVLNLSGPNCSKLMT